MALERRAVIDIGTNSVKLLVADVDAALVVPVFEESEQTRLGRDFYESHRLKQEAIADTAAAVAQFARISRTKNVQSLRVIATSAARDAQNQGEFLEAIKQASGLEVDIISGQQEADLVYQGVRSDPNLAERRLMILDVGGGSSEFMIGSGQHPELSCSFALGSVRLLEMMRPTDPPTASELERCRGYLREFFAEHIREPFSAALAGGSARTSLIGTGGAATILARRSTRAMPASCAM